VSNFLVSSVIYQLLKTAWPCGGRQLLNMIIWNYQNKVEVKKKIKTNFQHNVKLYTGTRYMRVRKMRFHFNALN
jgi:hypothetical protein